MCLSVCQSGACALQKRLNGSTSCLGWRLWGPKERCIRWGSRPPRREESGKMLARVDLFRLIRIHQRAPHSTQPSLNYFRYLLPITEPDFSGYGQTARKPHRIASTGGAIIILFYSVVFAQRSRMSAMKTQRYGEKSVQTPAKINEICTLKSDI